MEAELLTAERLRQVLRYDPLTGDFVRRVKRVSGPNPNKPTAGGLKDHEQRSIRITVDGKKYRAARLAWLYMTGAWPQFEVGHANGDENDVRWNNLRDLPKAIHMQNRAKFWGVEYRPGLALPYRVRIRIDGRKVLVGTFATEQEARAAYVGAKAAMHPGCDHWTAEGPPTMG